MTDYSICIHLRDGDGLTVSGDEPMRCGNKAGFVQFFSPEDTAAERPLYSFPIESIRYWHRIEVQCDRPQVEIEVETKSVSFEIMEEEHADLRLALAKIESIAMTTYGKNSEKLRRIRAITENALER